MSTFSDTVAGAFKMASAGTRAGVPHLPTPRPTPELKLVGGTWYVFGVEPRAHALLMVKDLTAAMSWAREWNKTAGGAAKIAYVRDGAARYPVDEI